MASSLLFAVETVLPLLTGLVLLEKSEIYKIK